MNSFDIMYHYSSGRLNFAHALDYKDKGRQLIFGQVCVKSEHNYALKQSSNIITITIIMVPKLLYHINE